MLQQYIGRAKQGDPAKRVYRLPIPLVRRTDRAYVPNAESGVYRGDIRRLIPSSREQVNKLNLAVQEMRDATICYIDLPQNSRCLSIMLAREIGYTDYEQRWRIVESALTKAFSMPIQDTIIRPKRRSIKFSRRRKSKRSAA